MHAVTTRTLEANGQSFRIEEAGEGENVAILLHGFPESRFAWRFQIPMLAQLGWRVIAPDLRGYGGSSRPPLKNDYAMPHLIEDVAALFDAAGARRRLLVGHDWGAMIAWVFAIQQRLPLESLIVMNVPHPAVFARVIRTSCRQRLSSWYVAFFLLPGLPEAVLCAGGAKAVGNAFTGMAVDKSRFPPDVTDIYRRNAMLPGAMTAMINYYRANLDILHDIGRSPAMINIPTLMVWGERDSALTIANTEGYSPYVRDFTLARLPGVSHWVQQEAPEQVNEIVTDWLKARSIAP